MTDETPKRKVCPSCTREFHAGANGHICKGGEYVLLVEIQNPVASPVTERKTF